MYIVAATAPDGKVLRKFLVEAPSKERAERYLRNVADQERQDGEPLWPEDSVLMVEPVSLVAHDLLDSCRSMEI